MQYLSTITNFDNHTHCLRLGNFFGQNLIQISFALLMLKISRQVQGVQDQIFQKEMAVAPQL